MPATIHRNTKQNPLKNIRVNLFNLLILLFMISFVSCVQSGPSRSEFILGTICTITLYENGKNSVYREVFQRIREIENLMSRNIPTSDVSRINASAGKEAIEVHEDTFTVIERALFFAEISGGEFDPTIGPLTALWNITGDNPKLPSQEEIDAAIALVNWKNIEIDRQRRSVFLKQEGMALDLGGIAKGYAADEAAVIIRDAKIRRAIIDLGGNIITIGTKRDRTPWRVGINNPIEGSSNFAGILQIGEKTVVTSGINERFFTEDDIRYHHILSTVTGFPVNNELLSVTIIAGSSMDADALSTAIFCLGYEKGRDLVNFLPNTEAVFVFENTVKFTGNVDFTLTDEFFTLIY